MIDIENTEFLIDVHPIAKEDFEIYSSRLFDAWDNYTEQSLKVPDYSISLEIEEGSIKGTGKIALTLGALYIGIGNYGDFISGFQTIRGQVSYLSDKLVESASSPFEGANVRTTYRNSSSSLSRLNKLFQKVQKGELTAEQATIEAEHILGDEKDSSPEFMHGLSDALKNAPRYPQQGFLFDEINDYGEKGKKKPSRSPRSKPDTPINQFRIEIWRESKRDKKKVKIINPR